MSLRHPQTTFAAETDDEILDYVLDPGNDFSQVAQGFDVKPIVSKPKLVIQDAKDLHTEAEVLGITEEELDDLKKQELEAIHLVTCDTPDFKKAEEIFTTIIKKHPHYASALNNRAQLYQLYSLHLAAVDPSQAKSSNRYRIMAFSDLNQAIMISYQLYPLFAPNGVDQLNELQKQNKTILVPRVLVQALCQRGLLHRLKGNEQQSYNDFKQAAALGSTIAQKEIVSLNPIAQLNHEIVAEIMQEWMTTAKDTENADTTKE